MQLPIITADHSIAPVTQLYISLSQNRMKGNLRPMMQKQVSNTNFVFGSILNWAQEQKIKIKAAISTGAQWEIWLQVELALFLSNLSSSSSGQVIREQKYDDSRKSLDILYKDQKNSWAMAIELKAQSPKTGLTSGTSMAQALLSDVKKLQELKVTQAIQGYNSFASMALGIGITEEKTKIYEAAKQNKLKVGAVTFDNTFSLYAYLVE